MIKLNIFIPLEESGSYMEMNFFSSDLANKTMIEIIAKNRQNPHIIRLIKLDWLSSTAHFLLLYFWLIIVLVSLPTYTTNPNNQEVYLILVPFGIKLSIVISSNLGSFFNFKLPWNVSLRPFGASYSNFPVSIFLYSGYWFFYLVLSTITLFIN